MGYILVIFLKCIFPTQCFIKTICIVSVYFFKTLFQGPLNALKHHSKKNIGFRYLLKIEILPTCSDIAKLTLGTYFFKTGYILPM